MQLQMLFYEQYTFYQIGVNMLLSKNRCIIVNITLLFALIFLVVVTTFFIYKKNIWLQSQLDYITPRFARLKGLERELDRMTTAIESQNQLNDRYLHDVKGDQNQVGNEILQNVRKILEISGFEINSAQVIVDVKSDGFNKFEFIIKGDSNITSLMSLLSGLKDLKHVVIIDSISIQSTGLSQPHVAQRIVVQLNLSSIRSRL